MPSYVGRREFLRGGGILALGTILGSPRVAAQGWEEVALVLSISSSVVGIVSGVSGMITNNDILSKIEDIRQKLDEVISLEYTILKEIDLLKLYIDQAILNGWALAYGRDIDAFGTEFDALSAAPDQTVKVIKDRWSTLAVTTPEVTVRLGDVDFGIFPFFAYGVAISLISFRFVKFPIASQRKYYSKFATQLDHWLDPANARSIPNSISSLGAEITRRQNALNNLPSKVLLSEVSDRNGPPRCYRHIDTYVNINGDFKIGYSGTQTTEASDWTCLEPPPGFGGGNKAKGVGVGELAIARALGIKIEDAANTIPTIPVFTPSGNAVVDARNQERIGIFQIMVSQAIQQGMSDLMDALRKTLRTL